MAAHDEHDLVQPGLGIEMLRRGVVLSDGPTSPAAVAKLRDSGSKTFFEITITEGRNRQVRRMVEVVGSKVLKLVRTSIGPLEIGKLEIGKHRALTAAEVKALTRSGSAHSPAQRSRNKPLRETE